ncbi:hypothetical protein RN001_014722 [Aquatica leii]|uniref:Uncharacterized protein n=1 Tax=Aquatica leii TaxID=1421715 RepID=A0AAN7P0Y3_9COLE|nr:hypothetical protein RN001_014722 [Aquatica leii]
MNDFTTTYNDIMKTNVTSLPNFLHCARNGTISVTTKVDLEICKEVPEATTTYYHYRTLLFVKDFNYDSKYIDVTMTTQMSFNKFPVFEMICSRWTGPISVAVYLLEDEFLLALKFINDSETLKIRKNIAYHIMFKEGTFHPINKLRNLALKFVNTPYVLLNDADFVPALDLYETINRYLKSMKNMKKKALIVPAFSAKKEITVLPADMNELKQMWNKNDLIPFHFDFFLKGHTPTDYNKLKEAKEPYTVKWQPQYEPYVVVESSVPKYDERFVGYIGNKIQHIMELEAARYEFIVLPNTFLVHKYHERSSDYQNYRKSKYYFSCIAQIQSLFVKEINARYNRTYTTQDI